LLVLVEWLERLVAGLRPVWGGIQLFPPLLLRVVVMEEMRLHHLLAVRVAALKTKELVVRVLLIKVTRAVMVARRFPMMLAEEAVALVLLVKMLIQ
jgi:hypothetical protein